MKFIDVSLSSWVVEPNAHLFRHAPRPLMAREADYEDRFDYFTIFYDAFWSIDGSEIIVVCPPLLNLEGDILGGEFYEMPSGKKCEIKTAQAGAITNIIIPVTPGTQSVKLKYPLGEYHILPQPNLCQELAGERILYALSKNNALHWIRDWVHYYVKAHGCTSVILYDNASDKYSKYDIRAALESIPGLKYAIVVNWNSPFGLPSSIFGHNDSKYLQRGMAEHVRQRLAYKARSVLHLDIDELVMSESGQSIFEATEQSSTGYVIFEGIWVPRVSDSGIEPPIDQLSHQTFRYVVKDDRRRSLSKWAIVPERAGERALWTTHRCYHVRPDHDVGRQFKHKHFFGLKTFDTNKKNKDRLTKVPFQKANPEIHVKDPVIAAQFQACFETEEYRGLPTVAPYAEPASADVCRRLAGIQASRRNYEEAVKWTRRAIALEPESPSYHWFLAELHTQSGNEAEAAAAASEAAALQSTSPQFRAVAAKKLRSAGNLEESEKTSRDLIAEFPEFADAYLRLGEILSVKGLAEDAEAAFRKSADMGNTSPQLLSRWAGELNRTERYADAEEIWKKLLSPSQGFRANVGGFKGLSRSLERQGRLKEAEEVLREGLEVLGKHVKFGPKLKDDFDRTLERIHNAAERHLKREKARERQRERSLQRERGRGEREARPEKTGSDGMEGPV